MCYIQQSGCVNIQPTGNQLDVLHPTNIPNQLYVLYLTNWMCYIQQSRCVTSNQLATNRICYIQPTHPTNCMCYIQPTGCVTSSNLDVLTSNQMAANWMCYIQPTGYVTSNSLDVLTSNHQHALPLHPTE